MTKSADPVHLASSEANCWSGSTLFAKAEYIQDQPDQGYLSGVLCVKLEDPFSHEKTHMI